MKKRVFKYKMVKAVVIIFNFLMLLVFGFGTFDMYNLFESEDSTTSFEEYFALTLGLVICSLSCISLIMVIVGSSKSIRILNILYVFFVMIFLSLIIIPALGNKENDTSLSEYLIVTGLICTVLFLIVLINKFKHKQIQYENIENIGTHTD